MLLSIALKAKHPTPTGVNRNQVGASMIKYLLLISVSLPILLGGCTSGSSAECDSLLTRLKYEAEQMRGSQASDDEFRQDVEKLVDMCGMDAWRELMSG